MADFNDLNGINCVLEAPTCAGQARGAPTLTNLDRSTWYPLRLEKKSERLFDDRLRVSIRVGLNPNFVNENITEKDLLIAWKSKHLFENLYDLELAEDDDSFKNNTENKITEKCDDVDFMYLTQVDWARNNNLRLKIRFNFVSSQFPFKRNLNSLDAIFILVVQVTSKNFGSECTHSLCQIQLFWPNLADHENGMAKIKDYGEQSTMPFCDHTQLRPYEPSQLSIGTFQDDDQLLLDDYAFAEQEQLDNDNDDSNMQSCQNYLEYKINEPPQNQIAAAPEQGLTIFIEHKSSFSIKLSPNEQEMNQINAGRVVVTLFELEKSIESRFHQNDYSSWSNQNIPMIWFDYTKSDLSSNILDIRALKTNQIEMIWIPKIGKDETVAFQVNCLPKDFENNHNDNPEEVSFFFFAQTKSKTKNIELGSAPLQVHTTQIGLITKMMQIYAKKHSDTVNEDEPLIEPDNEDTNETLASNNENIYSNNNNSRPFDDQIAPQKSVPSLVFGLAGIIFLLSLFYIQFMSSNQSDHDVTTNIDRLFSDKFDVELGKIADQLINSETIDQTVQLKLETELKKLPRPTIDYQKINKMIEHKLDQVTQPAIDYDKIERFIQEKLDPQLAQLASKITDSEETEKIVVKIISNRLKDQTESQISDPKVIDELIKEKIQYQFKNNPQFLFEQEKVEKFVQEKFEAEFGKIENQIGEKIDIKFENILNTKLNKKTRTDQKLEMKKMFEDTEENGANQESSSIEHILYAPTTAGISKSFSTLTNLDRSTWYELQLKKLNANLDYDKLLISFQLKLNVNNPASKQHNLLSQWKSLHPTERLFDLEYIQDDNSEDNDDNYVILDNNSKESDLIDTTSFYWNANQIVKLRIRFNVVHCQFPFKQSLTSNDVTFNLHVKTSSLTKASGAEVDNSFCQVKLFWPNGAAAANHKANQLLLNAKPYDDLVPASAYTRLTFPDTKRQLPAEFTEDDVFVEKLNSLLTATPEQPIHDVKNYLHYILADPKNTFVNVTTDNGERVNGFFLEQNSTFAIKLLPNAKHFLDLSNSMLRTRFEVQSSSGAFNEEELINWSASKRFPMVEFNYLRSKLIDSVYDIRQIEVNCVEVIWIPKMDQVLKELSISLRINLHENQSFRLKIATYMTKNGNVVNVLDCGSTAIFVTESGKVKSDRKNWLQQNSKSKNIQTSESSVLMLNDASLQKWNSVFIFNQSNWFDLITVLIELLVKWLIRGCLFLAAAGLLQNKFNDGFREEMIENFRDFAALFALLALIYATFIF